MAQPTPKCDAAKWKPLIFFSLYFLLNQCFLSPGPTKVIIIIASGREPVTHHYCKVESLPACQLLVDIKRNTNLDRNVSNLDIFYVDDHSMS